MPYLADNSYLLIKPESTAGVAVIPTIQIPLVSEGITTNLNHSVDRRMKGLDWQGDGLLRGNRTHEGEIVVLGDPDTLGHILNMVMTKGSTTGSGTDGYTHPFTVGDGDSYTFEIKKGLFAYRLFGVHVDEVKIGFEDGQMTLTLQISAMGQFSVGALGVALTGAGMTEIVFDDNYDINPTRGLVAGDVINIGGTDLTLLTVDADGVTVTFASTSLTFSVGEPIYLKPQTASLSTLQDPLYLGNVLVGFGVDEAAATTAAADRSTATPVYELEITLKNNLFKKNGSNRFDPVLIKPQTREAAIMLKQLLENENERQDFLDREKKAIVVSCVGKFIKADFSTKELFTLIFNNVKLIENKEPLEVGSFIETEQNYAVLYDASDAQAMEASLVNRTAGTVY